jgi:hypothetical protein
LKGVTTHIHLEYHFGIFISMYFFQRKNDDYKN